jgi:hypothetical protein
MYSPKFFLRVNKSKPEKLVVSGSLQDAKFLRVITKLGCVCAGLLQTTPLATKVQTVPQIPSGFHFFPSQVPHISCHAMVRNPESSSYIV